VLIVQLHPKGRAGHQAVSVMLKKAADRRAWPTTHWSLVGRAGGAGVEDRRRALTSLVQIYMPALRWHLQNRRGVRSHQVEDLLQEFLLSKVLNKGIVGMAKKERGSFRTFMATALDRFVQNRLRDQRALKRGGGAVELTDGPIPEVDSSNPAQSFDYAWARQVIGQVIRRMRRECCRNRRPDIWEVFKNRILLPALHNVDPVPYIELAQKLRIDSACRLSNVLVTANRMFARTLRQILRAYEKDESAIDGEIRALWQAVSRPRAGIRF